MRLKLIDIGAKFDPARVLTNPNPVEERGSRFADDGVFSESIFGKLPSSGKEYACDCRHLDGRFLVGTKCPKCGTAVICRKTLFSKRGWIDLGEHYIISPLFYMYLGKVIGQNRLAKILQRKRTLSVDGLEKDVSGNADYEWIGMIEFKEHWEEILGFFEAKRRSDPNVREYAALIRDNRDLIFVNHIPVYNPILRPAMLARKQFIFDQANSYYNIILAYVQAMQEMTSVERTELVVNSSLWAIQERMMEIFDHILNVLSGNGGYIRGNLLGVRLNFSGRAVIVPLPPGRDIDEIELPYLMFMELYRFHLINAISRLEGCGTARADARWHAAQSTFDRVMYSSMQELIRRAPEGGLPALLNRNPTISPGSILRVRITNVMQDPASRVLKISNNVLKLLGADYDGDVLNLVPLLDRSLADAFKVFDPRRMFIDRSFVGVMSELTLDKDHALGVSVLTE